MHCPKSLLALLIIMLLVSPSSNAEQGKDIEGGTTLLTNRGEIQNFNVNIPTLIPEINSVKLKEVNNGKQLIESYYIGSTLISRSQFVRFGGYGNSSTINYESDSAFINRIKDMRLYKDRLVGGTVKEITWGTSSAVEIRKGQCYWVNLSKRIKPPSELTGSRKDLLVTVAGCTDLKHSTRDMLKMLGFATDLDKSNFASRRSNPTSQTASTGSPSSSDDRRPIAATWEGISGPIAGFIEFSDGSQSNFRFTLPNGMGNCSGKATRKGNRQGIWFTKCDNGMSASGAYTSNGNKQGSSGEGYDNEGRTVKFTVAAE